MEHRGTVDVLDRPRSRGEHAVDRLERGETAMSRVHVGSGDAAPTRVPVAPPVGVGSSLSGPGLALLATVSLAEGYRWLGVFHAGSTGGGSFVFGTVAVACVALLTPLAAALLTARRDPGRPIRVAGAVVAIALAVAVTTVAALALGGHGWRQVAGAADIVLAAVAFTAVAIGEHSRNHPRRVLGGGSAVAGRAVDAPS
jgi:hypothetical protein